MIKYIVKRILIAIPILLGITLLDYLFMLKAGSPMEMLLGPRVTQASIAQKEAMLGLDQPMIAQYFNWLKEVLQGNLGYSFQQHREVAKMIQENVGPTLLLMGVSFLISMAISIPAGIYSAVKQYSKADYAIVSFSFIGTSVPSFFLALAFIYFFHFKLKIFPSSGMSNLGIGGNFLDIVHHMVLPVIVMVVSVVGVNIRYIRASMLEILQQDYLRTAKAKGIGTQKVIHKHALRNAMLPIVTVFGMQIPMLFAGSVVIEKVFNWPGLGLLTMNAILARDFPTIMGVSLMFAIVVLLSNLLADIVYAIVDPTIEYA